MFLKIFRNTLFIRNKLKKLDNILANKLGQVESEKIYTAEE